MKPKNVIEVIKFNGKICKKKISCAYATYYVKLLKKQ